MLRSSHNIASINIHAAVPGDLEHYSVAFFTALPYSNCCNAELPLRVGLIFTT